MKSVLALVALFVVPSGLSLKDLHRHIRGNVYLSRFDSTSLPFRRQLDVDYAVNNTTGNEGSNRQLMYHKRLRVPAREESEDLALEHHTLLRGDLAQEGQDVHPDLFRSMSMIDAAAKSKSSKKKKPKSKPNKQPEPKPKSSKKKRPKSNKDRKCSKKKPSCQKIPCMISKRVCVDGGWVCTYMPKKCKKGFSCDASVGKCKADSPSGCASPAPDCQQPANKCMNSTLSCLSNGTWSCEETPVECQNGFSCDEDSGDCVSTASECVEALRPTCLRPEENCMTNSSLCVNNTWTPCTPAPTECLAGYFCDTIGGECKVDPNTTTTLRMDPTLEWDVNCSSLNDTLRVAQIIEQSVYECMEGQLQSTVYVQELCTQSVENHTGYSGPSSRLLEENNMTDIELYIIVSKACVNCEKRLWNETKTDLRKMTGDGCLSASIRNKTDGAIQAVIKLKNVMEIQICKDPPPECNQPEDKCMTSNATCSRNGTWTCTEAAKVCEDGYVCDEADGVCKTEITRELHIDSTYLLDSTLILEGINEDQVVWDVAFASKNTSIVGSCMTQTIMNETEEIYNGTIYTSNFSHFMDVCHRESVELHVTFPRTALSICFGGEWNCRPVICSLAGELHKIDLDGDLSRLSYAPGNNELLFGLNKNCEIVEPYHWKEFVDVVIGQDFRTKWSNDELYRMDFDGDGLTNIVEYYGLRLGDMYTDIAYGGHPPVFNPEWPFQFPSTATDPYSFDTDGDLLTDSFELLYGMDPREANDIHADSDGEGLNDFEEQIAGTSPFKNDTDGDSVNDNKELQDGTNPLDDSDFTPNESSQSALIRRLELPLTVPITLKVGDHSRSHSERWVISVGSIEHAATEFGVVSTGTYNFHAGAYPITVRHIDSIYSSPDYDYTADVSWPTTSEYSHFDITIEDPENLLDVVGYSSNVDRTVGKIAYLRIKRVQEECNFDTCVDCNANSTCQWNQERKACYTYDGLISSLEDTPDDCACRKCSAWSQEERYRGLEWIGNLPRCPCHVVKDSISSSSISINMLSFEGGVTRLSTELNPEDTEVFWDQDKGCNPNNAGGCLDYHPGAYGCLRAPAFTGPHGQQCCYQSNGDYISAGTRAAGTPDYQESSWSNELWLSHYISDVRPYNWCCNECEISSMCDLYIGNNSSYPGVRADLRGCNVYSPSVCGDGICETDKGETCPQDCPPSDAVCGDGFCGHGETFYNCSVDCPQLPSTAPSLPSDPHDMNEDFLELASRCAQLSNAVYYKDKALAIGTVRDNFWEYIVPTSPTQVIDAALVSREYEKNRCIIALRGTNFGSLEDVVQMLNPFTRSVNDGTGKSCNVREGWAQAFFGTTSSGDPIQYHYGERLSERIRQCVSDNLKLVFTGHSQGGALALVGHLAYNVHSPISITFAAPPTFVNTVNDGEKEPCPAISDSQTYRFINTEHDEAALDYDFVPFIRELLGQLSDAVLTNLFPTLPNDSTVEELKRLAGRHKGPVALLPPDPDQSIKVYNDQSEIEVPSLSMFDIIDYGLGDSFASFASAHMMTTYMEKVDFLSSSVANGFKSHTQCNFDKECSSGTCKSPDSKRCLRLLLNNRYDCDSHEDCVDGRCDFNLFGYETCQPKLDTGSACERDADCKTLYCKSSICTAKLDTGSACISDAHCQSGYCSLLFKCEPLITDTDTACLVDDVCWTGRCKWFKCAYKLFDGSECDEDVDCQDGSFCDDPGICKKKLGLWSVCEEHSDCSTGLRCDFPAKKVCT